MFFQMGRVTFKDLTPFQIPHNAFSLCDSDLRSHFGFHNSSSIALFSSTHTPMVVRMPSCSSSSCTNIEVQQHAFLIAPQEDYYILLSAPSTPTTAHENLQREAIHPHETLTAQRTPPKRTFPLASYNSPPPAVDRSRFFSYPPSQHIPAPSSRSLPSSYPISPDTLASSTLVSPSSQRCPAPSVTSSSSVSNMPGRKVTASYNHYPTFICQIFFLGDRE